MHNLFSTFISGYGSAKVIEIGLDRPEVQSIDIDINRLINIRQWIQSDI